MILASSERDEVDVVLDTNADRITVRVEGAGERPLPGPDTVDLLPALFDDLAIATQPSGRRRISFSVPVGVA